MTLKSQCYFDILGCSFERLSALLNHPGTPGPSLALEVSNEPVFDDRHAQHSEEYGVPVNQLSLIYLVKEQPVVKTRQKYPRYETRRVLVSALEATGKTKTGV